MIEDIINTTINEIKIAYKCEVVYLGMGNEFKPLLNDDGIVVPFRGWTHNYPREVDLWDGNDDGAHYFAPLGSDIARLNGHVPKHKLTSRTMKL